MKGFFLSCLMCFVLVNCFGQKQQYKVVAVGFYNCENFFDTLHDPNKKDEEFTPSGTYHYTSDVYKSKQHNIATVLGKLGTDVTPDGAAIIGMAEVENDRVLSDLVEQPELKERHYKYAWFYTPDERGISTAMLYNPKYLTVLSSGPIHVATELLPAKRTTRDILHVYGVLAGDSVHILVNHWPSKSGGEAASAPGRKLAATTLKHYTDSLLANNPRAKFLILGDFNDNPNSEGIADILEAKAEKEDVKLGNIYNPWMNMYRRGLGTENYRGEWNLIDQIMVSGAFLDRKEEKWKFYNAEIGSRDFLTHNTGNNKGLPHRSFSLARRWDNGFSDHFPVLVYLVEKKQAD
jgi:endonuclease/exonuclease/phosphatase family metal-dependent hydrolase